MLVHSRNSFLYAYIYRTYGSIENTTAGGTPYPHSYLGRQRPSTSRASAGTPRLHSSRSPRGLSRPSPSAIRLSLISIRTVIFN